MSLNGCQMTFKFRVYFLKKLGIRVSQKLTKLGGEAHKMSGMEGGRELEKIVLLGRAGFNTGSNIGM